MYSSTLACVEAALRQQRAGYRAQRQQEQQHQRGAHRGQRAPGVAPTRERDSRGSSYRQPHVADERVAHPGDEVVPHAGDQRDAHQDQQHAAEDLDRPGVRRSQPSPAPPGTSRTPAARTGCPGRGSRRRPARRRAPRWRRRWPRHRDHPGQRRAEARRPARARTPRRAAAHPPGRQLPRREPRVALQRRDEADEHQTHHDRDHPADPLQQTDW